MNDNEIEEEARRLFEVMWDEWYRGTQVPPDFNTLSHFIKDTYRRRAIANLARSKA